MSAVEIMRKRVIEELLQVGTVKSCWSVWSGQVFSLNRGRAGVSANFLLEALGPNLAMVFGSTNQSGRSQSTQSGGGAAWEALVCWYMNLCLIGTRTVVFKKTSHVPIPVQEALTVTYGTVRTNTESDLVAVTFPEGERLNDLGLHYWGSGRRPFEELLASMMGQVEVCVIQCKTNWNENAQIPMLWDMVYAAKEFPNGRGAVGLNGHTPGALKRFSYAFVTVPTNKIDKFKINSLSVLRVKALSGGNFWGYPSKNGIAGSLADIFNRNFVSSLQSLGKPWVNHLDGELKQLSGKYSYFAI